MVSVNTALRRCAVYTRKSSEEGLEQDFNSLQAQREACEAFVRSQRGEGWRLLPEAYDDGGISGGTMQRPALQQLLSDIRAGKVNVIVVYKVDRLTRSLADFAKMVEIFDAQGVSFVAVTQQFNTTTSMGRLTLNVLLSFAQFEREVTGERIRDKIAASKRKGMWMGGPVPLGYRTEQRKLIPVPEEADQVRTIYRCYLEQSGVSELGAVLRDKGIRSKNRKDRPAGHFSRGALYALLSNPLYVGQIRHKMVCHPGQHEAIVDHGLWEQVQEKLKAQAVRTGGPNRKTEPSPLLGRLVDEAGRRLTPSHANKQGKRYRYYVSQNEAADHSWRLPALEIERRVEEWVGQMLADRVAVTDAAFQMVLPETAIGPLLAAANSITDRWSVVERVQIGREAIQLRIAIPFQPAVRCERTIPVQLRRRGAESRLVIPGTGTTGPGKPDPALVKLIGRALRWWDLMSTGQARTAGEIATREGIRERYVQRVLHLAMLAPDIVEAIVEGRQPIELTAQSLLLRPEIPGAWAEQRRVLGFS